MPTWVRYTSTATYTSSRSVYWKWNYASDLPLVMQMNIIHNFWKKKNRDVDFFLHHVPVLTVHLISVRSINITTLHSDMFSFKSYLYVQAIGIPFLLEPSQPLIVETTISTGAFDFLTSEGDFPLLRRNRLHSSSLPPYKERHVHELMHVNLLQRVV